MENDLKQIVRMKIRENDSLIKNLKLDYFRVRQEFEKVMDELHAKMYHALQPLKEKLQLLEDSITILKQDNKRYIQSLSNADSDGEIAARLLGKDIED